MNTREIREGEIAVRARKEIKRVRRSQSQRRTRKGGSIVVSQSRVRGQTKIERGEGQGQGIMIEEEIEAKVQGEEIEPSQEISKEGTEEDLHRTIEIEVGEGLALE